jgi:hypothetical protein
LSETDPKAQNKLAAIEAGLEKLTERSELNATQIDQLQVESVKKHQWYRDPPIIIAIIALAISIVSPVVAQKNLASDRERQDQTRLVELIQQLPGLRNNNASTDQFALVASEATQLMKRLPATPDQKLQVADAWKNAGDLLTAKELLESALTEATGSFQKATILRTLASIEFELQDYRAGRVDYERAIHTEETEMPGNLRFYFSVQDQLRWGNDELFQAGNCHGARQNAQQAEALLSHFLNPSNFWGDVGGDIRKFEADIAKNCK